MKLGNKESLIYWIGGSTCAGKSTISNILSETYGFIVYHCDEYLGKHIEKSHPQKHSNLNKVAKVSWDDILSMKAEDYINWTIDIFSEEFEMILEDIANLPDGKPILIEGIDLLPKLIKDQIIDTNNAIWLVADEAFYKEHQLQRREMFERIKVCANPEQALLNYMNFDLAFGKYIEDEAKRLDFKVIVIENDIHLMKNVEIISSHFKLT